MRTISNLLLLSTLTLVACQAADEASTHTDGLEKLVPIVVSNDPLPPISRPKSMLITNRFAFSTVKDTFTLGRMLTDRNDFMNQYIIDNDPPDSRPASMQVGTLWPFTAGEEQVNDHNAAPEDTKLGKMSQIRNRFREDILANWVVGDDEDKMVDPDGPFRMLAVVNRIDLAGEIDGRGTQDIFAEDQRKWFGEGRLVFGLTATQPDGSPVPMTLILEYRLPAIRVTAHDSNTTTFEVDPTFDWVHGPSSDAAWRDGRSRWARVWRELSRYDQSSAEYKNLLKSIVTVFARPENHIALRTGEQVRDATGHQPNLTELEYREFYTNGGFKLARRHVRREGVFCARKGLLLPNVIGVEWFSDTKDFHYNYKLGSQTLTSEDSAQLKADCNGVVPFAAGEEGGDDDALSLRAAFSRFQPTQVWPTLHNGDERERNKMAIRTCSGCHGGETGTPGFHIYPRGPGADAAVSAFLSGEVKVTPIAGGKTYTYNEMARREAILQSFYDKDRTPNPPIDLASEMLSCTTSPCAP